MNEISFTLEQVNLACTLCGIFVGIFLTLCAYIVFCLCDLISEKVKLLRERERK